MLNLTQHTPTAEQIAAGVIETDAETKREIVELLTFDNLPNAGEMVRRARGLAYLASQHSAEKRVLIAGAPFFMSTLERELMLAGFHPFYAFSTRESVEKVNADGSVTKTVIFRHNGFVEATWGGDFIWI